MPNTKTMKIQILFSILRGNAKNNEEVTETKDDKDDRLEIRADIIQIIQQKEKSQKFRAPVIPRKVATPFPPLNLLNIGNKCPKKTKIPENWAAVNPKLS